MKKIEKPKEIVIATRNPGKMKEIAALLKSTQVKFLSLLDFPQISEIKEDGTTFAENAQKKAMVISRLTGLLSLADDSGLCIKALQGRPGIFSSRFVGEKATDKERCELLLNQLQGVPLSQRKATFVCAIAMASPQGKIKVVEGKCQGLISLSPRGTYGFGFDPIFFLPKLGKTMAELTPEEKNKISHRAQALRKLKKILPAFLTSSCQQT
ncbi:MAG: XTP/dITP diphosphatase [Thermodesulfobacteriota bacterium]